MTLALFIGGLLAVCLGGAALLTMFLLAGIVRLRHVLRRVTWGCGYSRPSSRMAYTTVAYGELTQRHLLPSLMKPEVEAPVLQGPVPRSAGLVWSLFVFGEGSPQ